VNIIWFGSAFDMVHLGHIACISNAAKYTDKVIVSPCYSHKLGKQMAEPHHRLAMLELALKECIPILLKRGKVVISTDEIDHGESRGTYDILCDVRRELWPDKIEVLIGQDNANTISSWLNHEKLISEFPFLIAPRVGYDPPRNTAEDTKPWYETDDRHTVIPDRTPEVSSSTVKYYLNTFDRDIVLSNGALSHHLKLLPESTIEYIKKHNLYEKTTG
jgi:nicotinate (nicotinamide) nucleotide adenylyltransferase